MQRISDPNQTSVALGAQLFLTHFLVGLTAVILYNNLGWQVIFLIITAVTAGLLGLILNLNLQISLHRLHWILIRLRGMQTSEPIQPKRHGPLMGIMRLMAGIVEQERPFAHQREQFLQQASESAAQETRNRLGRDLHDSIKQQLFNINISTAAAQNQLKTNPEKAAETLADVRHSTQGALVEMNALLQQLSPAPLAKVGLVEALQEQCQALAFRTGAQVDVQIGALPGDELFPTGAQEAIFRIVQEALSNVARHARANHVTLALAQHGNQLNLTVSDDGQGFRTRLIGKNVQGMGLSNIKNRVSELDGTLSIDSQLNHGTNLSIAVPLLQTMTQEEQEMITTDHTLNRFSLIGIGGGVVLSALLFYPLYVYLPGVYLADWLNGTAVLSTLLLLLAIPLMTVIGYFSAKQLPSRTLWQQLFIGSIGTIIAFTIFVFLLGGGSAMLIGARSLFEQGFVKTDSEPAFLFQVIEGVNGIIWSWYPAFWGGIVVSVILGSLGSWFANQQVQEPKQLSEATRFTLLTSLTGLLMSSGVTVVVSLAVFPLLETQMREAAIEVTEAGFSLTHTTFGTVVWPLATVLMIYFLGLIMTIVLVYTSSENQPVRHRKELLIQTYTSLLVTLALPFFVIPVFEFPLWPRLIMGVNLLTSLAFVWFIIKLERTLPARWPQLAPIGERVLGGTAVIPFILLLFNQVEWAIFLVIIGAVIGFTLNRRDGQLSQQDKTAVAQSRLAIAFGSTLPSLLTFIIPQLPIIIVVFGLAATIIRAIPVLDPSASTNAVVATELVRQLYRLNIYGLLSYFVFALIIMGIMILVLKLSAVWQARRSQTS